MDQQYLYVLLKKYSQGTCSPEESAALEAWYAELGQELPDQVLAPDSEAAQQLTAQKLLELKARLNNEQELPLLYPVRVPLWKRLSRQAAIWGILVALGGAGYFLWHRNSSTHEQVAGLPAGEMAAFSRYFTLPDGSRVVLHAGSKLEYPDAFDGVSREVVLSGEAYFDIRPDSTKPFIISSGKLRTTVLGTAFNIRAYPGLPEITVSVTRGKVKVEDDKKLLGVLTPDQQIVYNIRDAAASQQKVNAAAVVNWTNTDMVFENATFETIAATLTRRYQVNIQFSDETLKQCPVRASFAGTEPLEKVLDVVCGVRSATYTIENGRDVLIKGKGCGL